MTKKAFVDQDLCIACGMCAANLPSVFRINDDGIAECFDPSGAPEKTIQTDAIDICPVSCICWDE